MSDASDAQEHVQRGVVSAVGSIGLATLASRVLGYVRDMVVAARLRGRTMTDAFFVGIRHPNSCAGSGRGPLSPRLSGLHRDTDLGGPEAFGRSPAR